MRSRFLQQRLLNIETVQQRLAQRACVCRITSRAMATPHVLSEVPNLESIKGVLFDIDGTLTNSDPLHFLAFQQMLIENNFKDGMPIDEAFYRQHISGRHNPEIAADLFPDWPEEKRVAFYTEKEQRFRDMAGSKLQRMPGLTEFLQWLDSRGLRKAAVTNAPKDNTLLMLKALKLDSYFEAVVLGEECERAKPHPDPYQKALRLLGLQPHEAIVIEDSPSGVRAAVAAGVPVFGITSGQEPAVLAAAGVCMLISDFHQLLQLAQQHCEAETAAVHASDGRKVDAGAAELEPIVVDSR
eukprot:GHUV01005136.1.p1 GENE.GHUV01005136.1~~GHUV01005136.1.p1  ORF type:complete len:298 (+),score=84.81 GHUV01005136.1:130-1023(+)